MANLKLYLLLTVYLVSVQLVVNAEKGAEVDEEAHKFDAEPFEESEVIAHPMLWNPHLFKKQAAQEKSQDGILDSDIFWRPHLLKQAGKENANGKGEEKSDKSGFTLRKLFPCFGSSCAVQ